MLYLDHKSKQPVSRTVVFSNVGLKAELYCHIKVILMVGTVRPAVVVFSNVGLKVEL